MFDLKDAEIKNEEAETILQNRKWCHYVPRLLANFIRENKMVSAVAAIWLPDTQRFFLGIEHMITRAQQQRNATASQAVRFFRLLCSQTGRIRRNFNFSNYEKFEESYAQLLERATMTRGSWKTTVPWKFRTVLGQVLSVVSRRVQKF